MNNTLAGLVTPKDYRDARPHVFPSESSLDWHIRRNRAEWSTSGALLLIAGRRLVNPPVADQLVLRLATATAEGLAPRDLA